MAQSNESALQELYRQHVAFMVAGDVSNLDTLLTPDFHLVHMTGMVQSKAEWLNAIKSGEMQYHHAQEDSLVVTGPADITGQDRMTATIWGSRSTWRLQLACHCVLQDGHWLIQHIQASTY
jgi:hypothetical protein